MKHCPKCGRELTDGTKFCSSCGTLQTVAESSPKRRKVKGVWILLAVIVVLIFGIFLRNNGETTKSIFVTTKEYHVDSRKEKLGYSYNYEYVFDELGNQIRKFCYDSEGALINRYEYEYDESGNQIGESCYTTDSQRVYRYEYTYDKLGNQISKFFYRSDGELECRYEYEYDGSGNQISEFLYAPDGELYNAVEYEYAYDYNYDKSGNYRITRYTHILDGEVTYKTEYIYDIAENLIKRIEYDSKEQVLSWNVYEWELIEIPIKNE